MLPGLMPRINTEPPNIRHSMGIMILTKTDLHIIILWPFTRSGSDCCCGPGRIKVPRGGGERGVGGGECG